MQFSFSPASAVQAVAPTVFTRHGKVTAAVHTSSLPTIDQAGFQPPAPLSTDALPTLAQAELFAAEPFAAEPLTAEPLSVVKQTIDDLEAQGLLMVFDRHDQVAKRLTEDLTAAGVLQGNLAIEPSVSTVLQPSETVVDSEEG